MIIERNLYLPNYKLLNSKDIVLTAIYAPLLLKEINFYIYYRLNCGGVDRQHRQWSNKCGVCGDDYGLPMPRHHEIGGEFGEGIISRNYTQKQVLYQSNIIITSMKTSISSEALSQLGAEKIAFPPKSDGHTDGRTDISICRVA